jgi:hypothetical protein
LPSAQVARHGSGAQLAHLAVADNLSRILAVALPRQGSLCGISSVMGCSGDVSWELIISAGTLLE